MHAEDGLSGLITDLEQQAEGLHLEARRDQVAALSEAEYAQVDLASRLAGSVGSDIAVHTGGGLVVHGRLTRSTREWAMVCDDRCEWLVPLAAVLSVGGLTGHSVAEQARTVLGRLSLASVLRGLARDRSCCVLHLVDGQRVTCRLRRVGSDFVEGGPTVAVPGGQVFAFSALAAVQGTR